MITRRSFVLGGTAVAVACRKQKGDGYAGFAFVANEEGHAIAAVDLTAFAVTRHIRLDGAPTGLVAHPKRPFVYALTPATGTVYEIDATKLAVSRKISVAGPALSMRLSPDGESIWIASIGGRRMVRVDLEEFRAQERIGLPEAPVDFDVSNYTNLLAVSHGPARTVTLIDTVERRVSGLVRLNGDIGTVRFRGDGEALLAGNTSDRMLTVVDARSARTIVRLPLSLRPDNFCFNADGGQLFITGEGRDAVVVAYPYYVPEIAATVLAGSQPGAMATTRQHLFVLNPSAGDLTILSVLRRRVVAITAVGADPGFVTITPDNEYALVLNRRSGDMAVIRIAGLQPTRAKSAALFTMIPVGSKPVSAVVKAV